ncbi:MAG: hypothetical protein AAFN27_22285 [Pseudomonadota bacterium]
MPWHDGEPPKDGREYVAEAPTYDGLLVVRWVKYNGIPAFRDWDMDDHPRITRWHDLDRLEI